MARTSRPEIAEWAEVLKDYLGTIVPDLLLERLTGGDAADGHGVEVPFRLQLNKVLVPASINGSSPMDFVLDSGAGIGLIWGSDRADELDLEPSGRTRVTGVGEGSGHEAAIIDDVTWGIGDFTLAGDRLVVVESIDAVAELARRSVGILGDSLFRRMVVKLDFGRQRMTLYDPDQFEYEGDGAQLDLKRRNHKVYVQARLENEAGVASEVELVVDTGARTAMLLEQDRIEKKLIDASSDDLAVIGHGLDGEVRARLARVHALHLGPIVLEDVVAAFPAEDAAGFAAGSDGNLGLDVLRRFTTTFDYSRERLILEPREETDEPFHATRVGITAAGLETVDDGFRVADVLDGSPADEAGIRRGDVICRIEDRPAQEWELDDVGTLFRGDEGRTIRLTIRRRDREKSHELKLRRLV